MSDGDSLVYDQKITFRVDKETKDIIELFAKEWGMPKSEVIRRAILLLTIFNTPLSLKDIIKEPYVRLLKKDPEAVLNMPITEIIRKPENILSRMFDTD